MDIDFENLSKLADNPEAFEVERSRIINKYINSLPPKQRIKALLFQTKLDQQRANLTPSEFVSFIVNQMDFNIRRIEELVSRIEEIQEGNSAPANVAYLDDFRRDGVSKKPVK